FEGAAKPRGPRTSEAGERSRTPRTFEGATKPRTPRAKPDGTPRPARAGGAERATTRVPAARTRAPGRGAAAADVSRGRSSAPRKIAQPVKASRDHEAAVAAPRTEHPAHEAYEPAPGTVRLSKRMSELGLCSRREADEWIENGWVKVDGERVDTLGARVRPEQHIEVTRDAHAAQARRVTILLNKPIGYVSGQAEDGYEPAAVLITAENRWEDDRLPQRFSTSHLRTLAPAGRLDIDSTGLLVLTQDGRIAKQLIGEHSEIEKEYLVRVNYGERTTDIDRHFPAEKLALLRFGLSLDGAALKPAKVSWQNGEQLRFVLREGKKRQIRRMCELVGLHVVGLKRVRMGRVTLGALPQGKWRYLRPDEAF
ncbi:pseudouridine synthase, partial [Trinickia caryophylli]